MEKEYFLAQMNTLFQGRLKNFRLSMIFEGLYKEDVELLQKIRFTDVIHEIKIEGYYDESYSILQHHVYYTLGDKKGYFLSIPEYTDHDAPTWYHNGAIEYYDIFEGKLNPIEEKSFSEEHGIKSEIDQVLEKVFHEMEMLEKVEIQYAHEEVIFLEKKKEEMLKVLKEGVKIETELTVKGMQYRIYENHEKIKTIDEFHKKFKM